MKYKNINFDERPFVVIWELTQACNLSCIHCRADSKPNRHPDELTTKEGKNLLKNIRKFDEEQLVVLSGGDPMMREDTLNLIEYGTDIGLKITMTPSGTSSLTPEIIKDLKNYGLRRMALSIDGATEESHDRFRQQKGSFNQTIKAAKKVKDIGLPLQINTTICKETVQDIKKIRKLVSELDPVLWSVFFLVPIGRGSLLNPISPEKAEKVMRWLSTVDKKEEFNIKTTEAPHYRRVVIQENKKSTNKESPNNIGRKTGVTAGNGFVFINHTGEVYPSGFLPKSAGNVKEGSIIDIYQNSSLFKSLRNPKKLKGKCGECRYKYICGGSRSRAYAYTKDPLSGDPLCSYIPKNYNGKKPKQEYKSKK